MGESSELINNEYGLPDELHFDLVGNERRASEKDRMRATARLTLAIENLVQVSATQKDVLDKLSDDVTDVKVDIQVLKKAHADFLLGYDKKMNLCADIHRDHEVRIREKEKPPQCLNQKRIEILEQENKDQNKNIYKMLGAALFIIPIITLLCQWGLKKLIP